MTLDALLGELRGRGYQMAVVLDEYGGTAGVATLEDCVEELVGDLVDEHDRTRAGVVRGVDSLTFPGILRPDELRDQAGVRVPESGLYETVAGYVVSELGRLPKVGDTVTTEQGTLEVLRMDGRRIDRLRFRADPDAPANRVETGPALRSRPSASARGGRGERLGRHRLAGRAARGERVLRRGRVRGDLRPALADRAAGGGGEAVRPRRARRDGARDPDALDDAARASPSRRC